MHLVWGRTGGRGPSHDGWKLCHVALRRRSKSLLKARMDDLAAVRAEQAARYAAAKAAEAPQADPVGSSRRKGSAPKKHVTGGAAARAGAAAGGPAAAAAAAAAVAAEEEEEEPEPKRARGAAPVVCYKAVKATTQHAPVKKKSVDQLAKAYYAASGYRDGDARGAAKVQHQFDALNRMNAVNEGRYQHTCDKSGRMTVTYRALRHDNEERVHALTRQETLDVLVAVLRKSTTTSRGGGGAGQRSITAEEQAARSSCVFWNAVRHFGSPEAAAAAASKVVQPTKAGASAAAAAPKDDDSDGDGVDAVSVSE